MATLFTKIIKGEVPCHKIGEDDNYLAFLDIRPIKDGHTLVIPKIENDYIFDLDDEMLGGLMAFAKKIAKKIEAVMPCERIGVMVAGLEVPHTHIHLIPIHHVTDLNFAHAKHADEEKLARIAQLINQAG